MKDFLKSLEPHQIKMFSRAIGRLKAETLEQVEDAGSKDELLEIRAKAILLRDLQESVDRPGVEPQPDGGYLE